jgi:hypothetical protein
MEYSDFGNLRVRTYTAGGALPIEGALIRIFGADEENRFIEYSIITDSDGISPNIRLPAPNIQYSQAPSGAEAAYADYDIEISKEGFYSKKIVGLPVFSGFTGGIAVPLGPSGGYLLGYLLIPICCFPFRKINAFQLLKILPGALLGLLLCYLCGTFWLSYQLGLSFYQAFLIGTLPYVPFDFIKLLVAYFMSNTIQKRLTKANLFIH